jgi:hypothetical protein
VCVLLIIRLVQLPVLALILLVRAIRHRFWGLLTLVIVYALVGTPFEAAEGPVAGVVGGFAGVFAYLAFWRLRWCRQVGAPFFESRAARREREWRALQRAFQAEIQRIEQSQRTR